MMKQMIYIHYSNGRVLQGVVLAFGDRVVRVAVKDSDDAAEYRLINRVWVSEDCEVVKMEFVDATHPAYDVDPDPPEPVVDLAAHFQIAPRVM